tara:strand:+ start:2133 stop:3302 length:1170 start_codon:yes stop_codon:yes gene_type:complete
MSKKSFQLKNFEKKFLIHRERKKSFKILKKFLNEYNEIIESLSTNYKNNYTKKQLYKYKKKYLNYRLIGIGGSILGAKAIYNFLKDKIQKNFIFIDNLHQRKNCKKNKNFLNLIVSKSGNTIETIINSNIFIKKKDKNIFITENKESYLLTLAKKLKSEIVYHNNFIGGRYSVLSEVGMLPAELMGLNPNRFKRFNHLIKNKSFLNDLVNNVATTYSLLMRKKFNSVIINYDEKSMNLFNWYQQLIAESLGKKNKGFLPIISSMPKDNHSVLQFYLDGPKNNFFTFFYVHNRNGTKIKNNLLLPKHNFLKNKHIKDIIYAQKKATENVFTKKNIPFRSFEIPVRNEEALGELFCFFTLETILLGRMLNVNPFDQPAVELIKKETKKLLI